MAENLDFLEFLKQLPCSVYWKDLSGVYLGCNNFMAKICGFSHAEEVIGKTDFDLSWRNTAEELRQIDQEVIKTGGAVTVEETGELADGAQIVYLSTKMPLRNEKNQIIGIFGVSVDISKHKQKEAILKKEKEKAEAADLAKFNLLAELNQQLTGIISSEDVTAEDYAKNTLAYLENILDSVPGNVYWMNRNCVYLGCNNNSARLMGLSSTKDAVGKTYAELAKTARWTEGQADSFKKDDMEVMATGVPKYNVEEPPVPSPEGGQIYYLTTRVPLRDKKKNIIGVVGNSIDITDRKRMEQELKEAKKNVELTKIYLENILANLPEPIYWMDRNGIMLGCNESEAKLFGLTSKEFVGKTIFDFAKLLGWKKEMADALRRNEIEILQTGEGKIVEEIAEIDKTIKTYISHKAPLRDDKGEIIGIIGTSIDITDRKRMEQELKEAKENAEAANEVIKIFAASIAHELRTPLASISGNVYGVTKYLPILIDAYQKAKEAGLPIRKIRPDHYQSLMSLSNNIGSEIEYAKVIIDMLLMKTNSQVEKNIDFKACSIRACVKKALSRYPFKSDKEKSLITWKTSKDFLFRGTELFIIHALFNLIKNALYYIEAARKGEITIWLEMGKTHNYLHFRDTGKGVKKEFLPHIFDSYFSKTPNGAGVGLAFCKQVMHNFSGGIECQSKEEEYTHFILSFPVV